LTLARCWEKKKDSEKLAMHGPRANASLEKEMNLARNDSPAESRPAIDILVCLLLAAAVFIVYWRVTGYGFISFDDPKYVRDNPNLGTGVTLAGIVWAFTSVYAANWHPLTWISHMLDVQLFGMDPGMHHLVNIAFHAANAVLVFTAFRLMTGRVWRSAAVAALFAIHPLHVESVAWIAERKDVLSTLFYLAAIVGYVYYARRRTISRYLLVLLLFILGLLSKPMTVTLPFVLLLLDFWPLGRTGTAFAGPYAKEDAAASPPGTWPGRLLPLVVEKIPLMALAVCASAMTIHAQNSSHAITPMESVGPGIRLMNAAVSYLAYIEKTLAPVNLAVFYPYQMVFQPSRIALSVLLLGLVSVLAIMEARKLPYLAVGWLWFLGTLVPVIGLIQVGAQSMADRYTYLPHLGLFLVIVWSLADLLGRGRKGRIVLGLLSATAVALLMWSTRVQISFWESSETLMRHAVESTENNDMAHCYLGVELLAKGDVQGALREYLVSHKINPRNPGANEGLGSISFMSGRYDLAIAHYQAALSAYPDHPESYYNLGSCWFRKGDFEKAVEYYKLALKVDPGFLKAARGIEVVRRNQAILTGAKGK
jgi:protein O-mannosyl-transferase